jgi:hypothetical protein
MAWEPPQSAQNIPMRPLDKGVDRGTPPQLIPVGGFLTINDILVTERGLVRRAGFTYLDTADPIPYMMRSLAQYLQANGTQANAILTEDTLYKYHIIDGVTECESLGDSGTSVVLEVDGTLATCATATWADADILPGDLLRVSAAGTTYEAHIGSVAADTTINLGETTIPDGFYTAYKIQKTFRETPFVTPDTTVIDDSLVIADGKRPLQVWNGGANTLAYWTTEDAKKLPGGVDFVPKCVLAMDDRIWVANTYDATDGHQRQRIRWSALADPHDFSQVTNFLDLPYTTGEIVRIAALGPNIVAYFSDGIYIGTRTNFPLLPRRFDRLETGGVGLVGAKALTSWANVHFFIGQDNIYALSVDGQITPIATKIFRDIKTRCNDFTKAYAIPDPTNSQVIFGFPTNGIISECWFFNLNTKAWSSGEISTSMLAGGDIQQSLSWSSLATVTDWQSLGTPYPTWNSLGSRTETTELIIASAGRLWKADPSVETDFTTDSINTILESGDLDFNQPDALKVVTRLSVKINRLEPSDDVVSFTVEGSTNAGRRWKQLGTLTIRPSVDEASVSFRQIGGAHRFRLSSTSLSPVFAITDWSIRIRGSGEELSFGTQNG